MHVTDVLEPVQIERLLRRQGWTVKRIPLSSRYPFYIVPMQLTPDEAQAIEALRQAKPNEFILFDIQPA